MAIKQFDFALFQELKLTKGYKENYFKQAKIKNAKEALFFIDYKMAGKKEDFLMIPFKKKGEGKAAFFTNKSKVAGSHLLKKTCYGVIEVAKIAGKQIVVVDIKRGGISPDILEKRLNKLFEDFGLDFVAEVVGQNAIIAEDTDIQTNPSSPEDKKNSDKLKKIITNLSGVKQYIGKKEIHELEQLLVQNKSDLELYKKEAMVVDQNGEQGIDEQEKKAILAIEMRITKLETQLSKLVPQEKKDKMLENLNLMNKDVIKILSDIDNEINNLG